MKMEEFGIKTWERQNNTHSFVLFMAVTERLRLKPAEFFNSLAGQKYSAFDSVEF